MFLSKNSVILCKVYIPIFVGMATKATHRAEDLSTEAFMAIMAILYRFVAEKFTYGKPISFDIIEVEAILDERLFTPIFIDFND